MRDIRYKTHGAVGWDSWKHGSLTEFLFDVPHLAHVLRVFRVIPPIHILNELFASGVSEAGMSGGCKWSPFEMSESEYVELVEELVTLPGAGLFVDVESRREDNMNSWTSRLMREYTGRDSA